MTALRLGDMQHLRWCDIKMIDGVPTISIIQRKTKRPAIIPLNEMAQSLLPPRTDDNPESLVFHLVKKSDNVSKYVRRLKEKAGIEKDLTCHCSRHTTASLAISAGADISAVKDVLGHGSITSTEVYAKVALEKKIEAAICLMACLIETYSRVRTMGKSSFFPFVGKLPSGCIQKTLVFK